MNPPPPIEGYRWVAPAGAGAMGEVWRGEHVSTGAPVAIKRLPHHENPRIQAFHDAEIRATATLDHPNIVRIVDTGVLDGGDRWLALEWCGGGTLEGVTDWPTLDRALREVLAALAHAHARKVLHRDIKPGNVLFDDAGIAKLADFGVARVGASSSRVLVGSPGFIAPEVVQRQPEKQGPPTDLYSLGCMIWELATGFQPFFGEPSELFVAHVEAPLPPFQPRFAVPEGLEGLVRDLLRKEPSERPQSAAEALHRLVHLADGAPWDPTPAAWVPEAAPGRDVRFLDAGLALLPHREPRLVGRSAMLASLWERFGEVVRTGAPYVVVLTGESGVGRSRIAHTLGQEVARLGLGRWDAATLDLTGLAAVEAVWGGASTDAIARWRGDGPAVMVLDDVDDPLTASALGDLVAGHVGPLLWLVTAEAVPQRLVRRLPEDLWEELVVRALGTGDVGNLLRQLLGLHVELNARVVHDADGMPGRAVGQVRGWVAADRLHHGPLGFELVPGEPPPADPDLQRALQLVALAGGRLDATLWERACAQGGVRLDWASVFRLVDTGAVELETRDDRATIVLHPTVGPDALVDDALRGGIRDAARALLALLPADHRWRGLLLHAAGEPRAGAVALIEAATAARAVADYGTALQLVRRAEAATEGLEDAWDIRWNAWNHLSMLHVDTWQVDEALALIQRCRPALPHASPSHRAEFWIRVATAYRYKGDHDRTREALERAQAVIERSGDAAGRASTLQACASQLVSIGDPAAALPLARRALELSQGDENRGYAYLTIGRIHSYRQELDAAVEALTAGIAVCPRPAVEVALEAMLGETLSRHGDPEQARVHLDRARAIAAELPNYDMVMLDVNVLANDLRGGAWASALSEAQRIAFDPRVRRLAIARLAVEQMRITALAGLGRWDELATRANALHDELEAIEGFTDPDFAAFSALAADLATEAPSSTRAAVGRLRDLCAGRLAALG
ncbi:MAG: protein kinase [Alphaproteobacteria bacterium]|nr:protein kinase [Alphaproteobacteria bacterium]